MALRLVRSLVSEPTAQYGTEINLSGHALEIHHRALERAKNFRTAYSDMIDSLREVEDESIHLRLELTSIYQYATKILKLSEDVACDLIAIMRKSRVVPELSEKIRDCSITASKARKLVSVINPEIKSAWLDLASTNSSREIEKAVASVNPQAAVAESVKYKTSERLEFKIGVSEEWIAVLADVKDLLSQREKRNVSSEEALMIVMREFQERHDPLRRAERARDRRVRTSPTIARVAPTIESSPTLQMLDDEKQKISAQQLNDGQSLSVPGRMRERLTAAVKNEVLLRDQRQCRHIHADGTRCEHRRWLDVHHIKPVAYGGTNVVDNLITLCTAHHSRLH